MTDNSLEQPVKSRLSKKRYSHSLRTADFAAFLCIEYGENAEKGRTAGLLHDIARELSKERLIALAKKQFVIEDWEKEHAVLLHGKSGAVIAKETLQIEDKEVLAAIADHVTGRPGMTAFSKIIFIADYCEPGRTHIGDDLKRLIGRERLDKILHCIIGEILHYLGNNGKFIASPAIELYRELEKKVQI